MLSEGKVFPRNARFNGPN